MSLIQSIFGGIPSLSEATSQAGGSIRITERLGGGVDLRDLNGQLVAAVLPTVDGGIEYRDPSLQLLGSADVMVDGSVRLSDAEGKLTGTLTENVTGGTDLRGADGSLMNHATEVGGVTQVRDINGGLIASEIPSAGETAFTSQNGWPEPEYPFPGVDMMSFNGATPETPTMILGSVTNLDQLRMGGMDVNMGDLDMGDMLNMLNMSGFDFSDFG